MSARKRSINCLRACCSFLILVIRTRNISWIDTAMTAATFRSLTLIEVLAFSAFVAWYIWQLQAFYWNSWIVFPVWLGSSFIFHRDTPKTICCRSDNLWLATKRSAIAFRPCVAPLFFVGIFLGAMHCP